MNRKKLKIKIILFFSFAEEILVIIDFCQFGNLKSYLIKNRKKIINQLNGLGNSPPTKETAEINTFAWYTIPIQ
jgi:hypothetical protein